MSEQQNDPIGEATLVVQLAIKAGLENGVPSDGGVFVGMLSPVGRLVLYLTPEDAEEAEGPRFTDPEDAVAWIALADDEDAYQLVTLKNALSNWKRLASVKLKPEDLFELGSQLYAATIAVSTLNTHDKEALDAT